MPGFALTRVTQRTYDEALAALPELLEAEGFGVLTRIDVKGAVGAKAGTGLWRVQIAGARRPQLAHLALSTELAVGTRQPNVVVQEGDDGHAVVVAIHPEQAKGRAPNPESAPVVAEVRTRLERVLAALDSPHSGAHLT